jgi:beta-fructofuranosidase
MLQLADRWVWDFWFAREGPRYHVFFLQAPKSLVDPDLRHWNASVGHAV